MSRYRVQFQLTIDVQTADGREAVPAAVAFLEEAMAVAQANHREANGDVIQEVKWRREILSSMGD